MSLVDEIYTLPALLPYKKAQSGATNVPKLHNVNYRTEW